MSESEIVRVIRQFDGNSDKRDKAREKFEERLEKNSQDFQFKLLLLTVATTIVATLLGAFVGFQLQESYLVPNKPLPQLVSYPSFLSVDVRQLVDPSQYPLQLYYCVINSGRLDTGFVNVDLVEDWLQMPSSGLYPPTCSSFPVRWENYNMHQPFDSKYLGNQTIRLNVTCELCRESSIVPITLCIYNSSNPRTICPRQQLG